MPDELAAAGPVVEFQPGEDDGEDWGGVRHGAFHCLVLICHFPHGPAVREQVHVKTRQSYHVWV